MDPPNKAATTSYFRYHIQGHMTYQFPNRNLLVGLNRIIEEDSGLINYDFVPGKGTSDVDEELELQSVQAPLHVMRCVN